MKERFSLLALFKKSEPPIFQERWSGERPRNLENEPVSVINPWEKIERCPALFKKLDHHFTFVFAMKSFFLSFIHYQWEVVQIFKLAETKKSEYICSPSVEDSVTLLRPLK